GRASVRLLSLRAPRRSRRSATAHKKTERIGPMRDKDIAAIFAGQTAITARLFGMLIDKGLLSHDEVVKDLEALLAQSQAEGAGASQAPIRHLLSVLAENRRPAGGDRQKH